MKLLRALYAACAVLGSANLSCADRFYHVTDGEPGAKPPINVPVEPKASHCGLRFARSLEDAIRDARAERVPLLIYFTQANNRNAIEPEMREALDSVGRFPKRFHAVIAFLEGNASPADRIARLLQLRAVPTIAVLELAPDGSTNEKLRIVGIQSFTELRSSLGREFGRPDPTQCTSMPAAAPEPPRTVPAQCRMTWRRDVANVVTEAMRDGRRLVLVVDGSNSAPCADCATLRGLLAGGALASFGNGHHAVWVDASSLATMPPALARVIETQALDRDPVRFPALLVVRVAPQGTVEVVDRMPAAPKGVTTASIINWLADALAIPGVTKPECLDAMMSNRF